MNRRTIKVPDDNGRTRSGWQGIDGRTMAPEDLDGLSIIHGATGGRRGRPRKVAGPTPAQDARESFYFGYVPSTRAGWAKEREEREAALARVAARRRTS